MRNRTWKPESPETPGAAEGRSPPASGATAPKGQQVSAAVLIPRAPGGAPNPVPTPRSPAPERSATAPDEEAVRRPRALRRPASQGDSSASRSRSASQASSAEAGWARRQASDAPRTSGGRPPHPVVDRRSGEGQGSRRRAEDEKADGNDEVRRVRWSRSVEQAQQRRAGKGVKGKGASAKGRGGRGRFGKAQGKQGKGRPRGGKG